MPGDWHYSDATKHQYAEACEKADPTVKKMYEECIGQLENVKGMVVVGRPAYEAMVKERKALKSAFFDKKFACMAAAGRNGIVHYLQFAIGWANRDQLLALYNCVSELYCRALGIPRTEFDIEDLDEICSITIAKEAKEATVEDLHRYTSNAAHGLLDIFGESVGDEEVADIAGSLRFEQLMDDLVEDGEITKQQELLGAVKSCKAAAKRGSVGACKK